MNKVVYNTKYGLFGLSEKAVKMYCKLKGLKTSAYLNIDKIVRHDPILIQIVEELGTKANGPYANLSIAEIEGDRYRISEYDGVERVITPEMDAEKYIKID